jgi:ribosomal protein S18 acetylase RimI-like enzyme
VIIALEIISPKNATTFKDIRLRALQDSPTAFSSTFAEESKLSDADWVKRAAQWSGAKSIGYLALDDCAAVGIAAGILNQTEPSRADLVSMWVAPTHRRVGIGRTLVEAIVAWARTQNVRTLLLLVTSNNGTAINFYQRLGFSLTGKTEPYRNDPSLLNYEMRRSIS